MYVETAGVAYLRHFSCWFALWAERSLFHKLYRYERRSIKVVFCSCFIKEFDCLIIFRQMMIRAEQKRTFMALLMNRSQILQRSIRSCETKMHAWPTKVDRFQLVLQVLYRQYISVSRFIPKNRLATFFHPHFIWELRLVESTMQVPPEGRGETRDGVPNSFRAPLVIPTDQKNNSNSPSLVFFFRTSFLSFFTSKTPHSYPYWTNGYPWR